MSLCKQKLEQSTAVRLLQPWANLSDAKQRHRAWYMQFSRPETDLSAKTFAAAIGSKEGLRAKHPDQGVDRMDSENKRIYKTSQAVELGRKRTEMPKTQLCKKYCPAMDCRTWLLLVRSAYQICQR